jgi:hypothetical protein
VNTNAKGASLYKLLIPSAGTVEVYMTASQALRFVASIEQQIDETIPRSLRVAPATIAEIETRQALQQAREALTRALNQSATGSTLADAISALDRALAIPSVPASSIEPEPSAYDCLNWAGDRYLRRTQPTDGNRFIPLYPAKGSTWQTFDATAKAQS